MILGDFVLVRTSLLQVAKDCNNNETFVDIQMLGRLRLFMENRDPANLFLDLKCDPLKL